MKLARALARAVVAGGKRVDLHAHDPRATSGFRKAEAQVRLEALGSRLRELQEVLAAERLRQVLVVLQGMDTSGKDGAIAHVFEHVNPQGVRVARFAVPTPEELAHDFLWRVHARAPAAGELVIFNRSHYEDVLVPRAHGKISPDEVKRRYAQINAFEALLAETGTTILKFFLHISRREQKERLLARLRDPTKVWKFERGDLRERALWKEYAKAYEGLLEKTTTTAAPWRIIPSDRKWHRNLLVAGAIVEALEAMHLKYPPRPPGLAKVRIR